MRQPTYEGRPLPRPGDDLVDQGLTFDVGTLLSRRRTLRLLGVGAGAIAVTACAGGTPDTIGSATDAATAAATDGAGAACGTTIPEETAGPFPGDGSNGPDVLSQSGVVRGDIRSSFGELSGTADGVQLDIELYVEDSDAGCVPYAGAAVYLWQCDREGRYSLYSEGVTDQNYLRGVQEADADGIVRFTSTFPGCYDGRWPHIHFEVFPTLDAAADVAEVIATSQIAVPQEACEAVYATEGYDASVANLARVSLDQDGVFGDDGGALQLGTTTGSVAEGFTIRLDVPVSATT